MILVIIILRLISLIVRTTIPKQYKEKHFSENFYNHYYNSYHLMRSRGRIRNPHISDDFLYWVDDKYQLHRLNGPAVYFFLPDKNIKNIWYINSQNITNINNILGIMIEK